MKSATRPWIACPPALPGPSPNHSLGGNPITLAIARSFSKSGVSTLPRAKRGDVGAGHDTTRSTVEVLPAPLAAVGAAVGLQEAFELLRNLNHGLLVLVVAAVHFKIPRAGTFNLHNAKSDQKSAGLLVLVSVDLLANL